MKFTLVQIANIKSQYEKKQEQLPFKFSYLPTISSPTQIGTKTISDFLRKKHKLNKAKAILSQPSFLWLIMLMFLKRLSVIKTIPALEKEPIKFFCKSYLPPNLFPKSNTTQILWITYGIMALRHKTTLIITCFSPQDFDQHKKLI